jgi:hypothetical protein
MPMAYVCPVQRLGWASCWRAEPEMDALLVLPRGSDMSDAARAQGACPHSRQRFS